MRNRTVGEYLLCRLKDAGMGHLFGVPGDYNLQFLDAVINSADIGWVGCANELNAAYAADGYARCRGAAALLTTFGVGELSALNGVAGSFAEYLPVVHIVGAPSRAAERDGLLLHHTLGDGDYQHFLRMSQEVTVAQAVLTPENAAGEIDRLLLTALREHRPVYLYLPTDVAVAEISPPDDPLPLATPCDPAVKVAFANAAEQLLASAKSVALLADFLADRAGQQPLLRQILTDTPMTFATLLMGKGVLPEQLAGFAGTYAGAASAGKTRQLIEQNDLLIAVGVLYTDTITAGFTQQTDPQKTIDIGLFSSRIGEQTFAQLPMAAALSALQPLLERYAPQWSAPLASPPPLNETPSDTLTQNTFWQAMQDFLQPGDIVLADQGTAAFGAAALRLPEGVTFITQPLWGSIGYTLPAAYGAQIACPDRRVVLLSGDGSAQLTIQELGSILRDDMKPVIFILNNGGYTVERAIHGEHQRYNDIAAWNWTQLPQAFSLNCPAQSWRVMQTVQLAEVMQVIRQSRRLSLVEVVLPPLDVPPLLQAVTAALNKRNSA
ncbi:indolepyruvate decarboxylase [Erwinia typographi]|uniref:Indolepyruvate decarboxylase n=1 Tax=Erwinia typographi TaxID=371042 RepID=A0A0A3YH66_9GAMM|nr:thiamine pyrophosphate-binding protein [Erwinia typographi]KGT86112.1 indolepyruvate decarboxylase [Erwinia typographi]